MFVCDMCSNEAGLKPRLIMKSRLGLRVYREIEARVQACWKCSYGWLIACRNGAISGAGVIRGGERVVSRLPAWRLYMSPVSILPPARVVRRLLHRKKIVTLSSFSATWLFHNNYSPQRTRVLLPIDSQAQLIPEFTYVYYKSNTLVSLISNTLFSNLKKMSFHTW